MLEVDRICKSYGPAHPALRDVSFRAQAGEIVALLGENGAGKTTLLRILAGLLHPDAGRACIAGLDVTGGGRNAQQARARLGYLPEDAAIDDDLRVSEYLQYRAGLKGLVGRAGRTAVDDLIDAVGLRAQARALLGALSKGYRRRVGLADALLGRPAVLLLDEPTDGLDPAQRAQTLGLIANLGRAGGGQTTVLLSTHLLPEAESICHRVVVLDRGTLRADGTPAEVAARAAGRRILQALARGAALPLQAAVAQVAGVAQVAMGSGTGDPDLVQLRIELADDADAQVAERVARAIVSVGELRQLSTQSTSLQALFHLLTARHHDAA